VIITFAIMIFIKEIQDRRVICINRLLSTISKGYNQYGYKIYNLPSSIKETYTTPQIFKFLLKISLYSNSFYSLDEDFNYNLSYNHISLCILIHISFTLHLFVNFIIEMVIYCN
jgi:hypothetical protein